MNDIFVLNDICFEYAFDTYDEIRPEGVVYHLFNSIHSVWAEGERVVDIPGV